jgi:hypothetical protein
LDTPFSVDPAILLFGHLIFAQKSAHCLWKR